MGFTTGAKVLADIINEMANGLIATIDPIDSLPKWSDNESDPILGWNTTTRTADLARRSLKYTNGIEELYVALEAVNTATWVRSGQGGPYYTNSKGIRITLSASWDSALHTYPSLNQQSFIQFETWNFNIYANGTPAQADLATLQVIYYLWVESNGFVIMAKPEPTPVDAAQQSFFMCLERNTNKEYADGYSNFVAYMQQNVFHSGWAANRSGMFKSILRPFAYQYPTDGENYDGVALNGAGITYWLSPTYSAYKSQSTGKVYYVKPIVHNHASQFMPIFQINLFFPFSESVGLIDGDVIAIEGTTTKYLCKSLDSPDSTARLNFAMKYVA